MFETVKNLVRMNFVYYMYCLSSKLGVDNFHPSVAGNGLHSYIRNRNTGRQPRYEFGPIYSCHIRGGDIFLHCSARECHSRTIFVNELSSILQNRNMKSFPR